MKTRFIFLAIISIGILSSCGSGSKTLHLKGTITNPDAELIDLATPDTSYTIKLDTLGAFDATIGFPKSGYVSMNYGGRFNTLYLEPGNDLTISFDTENIVGTLKYEGEGSVPNNVLNMIRQEISKLPTDDEIMTNTEEVFLSKIDSISALLTELLTLNRSQLGSEFFDMESAKIKYRNAEMMVRYPSYHAYLVDDFNFKVSEKYWDRLKSVSVNESSYIGIYQFDNFVYGLVDMELAKSPDLNITEEFKQSFVAVDDIIMDAAVRNTCYTHNFYKYLSSGVSYEDAKPIYDKYGEALADSDKDQFDEVLSRLSKLQSGSPSPDFKFVSMYGDTVRSEVLKGKNLFLSVWSTTNIEFMNEIPQLLELQKKYGDKVQFVYVSLDDSVEDWQLLVREMNLPDIQLFASEGWAEPILYDFVIEKLPRHIMIDQNGNIINAHISVSGDQANAESELQSAISNLNL